jgi:hypothetical protein
MNTADAFHAERESIRLLEKKRYRAMLTGDVTTLGRLLSDQLCYSHSNGSRDTKESLLRKMADSVLKYIEVEHGDDSILFAGDAAVVVGRMIATVELGGSIKQLDNRCLAVWSKVGGSWQLLAYQPTPATAH